VKDDPKVSKSWYGNRYCYDDRWYLII